MLYFFLLGRITKDPPGLFEDRDPFIGNEDEELVMMSDDCSEDEDVSEDASVEIPDNQLSSVIPDYQTSNLVVPAAVLSAHIARFGQYVTGGKKQSPQNSNDLSDASNKKPKLNDIKPMDEEEEIKEAPTVEELYPDL